MRDDLRTREDATGLTDETLQKIELAACEGQFLAVHGSRAGVLV